MTYKNEINFKKCYNFVEKFQQFDPLQSVVVINASSFFSIFQCPAIFRGPLPLIDPALENKSHPNTLYIPSNLFTLTTILAHFNFSRYSPFFYYLRRQQSSNPSIALFYLTIIFITLWKMVRLLYCF